MEKLQLTSSATKRTFWTVMWNKLLDTFEKNSMKNIFKTIWLTTTAIIITATITIDGAGSFLLAKVSMNNYFILKAFTSFICVFKYKSIWKYLSSKLEPVLYKEVSEDNLEWIPHNEILEHLFTNKSFKQVDIVSKFNIPVKTFTALAQKFEDLKILKRGENNSRILNEDITRQEIVNIIKNKNNADELEATIANLWNWKYSFKPSAKIIEETVEQQIERERLQPWTYKIPQFSTKRINP